MFDRLKDVVGWYNRGIAYARILVTDLYPPFHLAQCAATLAHTAITKRWPMAGRQWPMSWVPASTRPLS
jgi:hypothetical protein